MLIKESPGTNHDARYYDPTIGRFISADTLRQGLN